MQQFEVARLQDPASPIVLRWLGFGYYLRRQRDSALVLSRQAVEADMSSQAVGLRSQVLARYGDRDSVLSFARAHPEAEWSWYALAVAGDTVAARTRLRALEQRIAGGGRINPNELALLYLGLADTAAALGTLERYNWSLNLAVTDPIFDPIRASPRFLALLPRLGLPRDAARITARARSSPAPSPGPRR